MKKLFLFITFPIVMTLASFLFWNAVVLNQFEKDHDVIMKKTMEAQERINEQMLKNMKEVLKWEEKSNLNIK